MKANMIDNEIEAAHTIRHPGIVNIFNHFHEGNYTYLIMEYIQGEDLFQFMSANGFQPMEEKLVKKLFRQLVESVNYCHSHCFVHRDLKLENIIITKKGKAKLIDFGLCQRMKSRDELCNHPCGSQDYIAPEILKREAYDGFKADVWSLGVILYTMIYSEIPFAFQTRMRALSNGDMDAHPAIVFPDERVENPSKAKVDSSAKHLILQMLKVDPKERICLEDVAKHPWLRKKKALDSIFGIKKGKSEV